MVDFMNFGSWMLATVWYYCSWFLSNEWVHQVEVQSRCSKDLTSTLTIYNFILAVYILQIFFYLWDLLMACLAEELVGKKWSFMVIAGI